MAADGAAAAAAVPAPAAPLQVIDELIIAPIDRHAAAAPLAEDRELIELARRFSRAFAVHRTAPSVIPSSLCSEPMSAVWFLKGTPPEVADKLFKVLRPMTIVEDDDRHNDGRGDFLRAVATTAHLQLALALAPTQCKPQSMSYLAFRMRRPFAKTSWLGGRSSSLG